VAERVRVGLVLIVGKRASPKAVIEVNNQSLKEEAGGGDFVKTTGGMLRKRPGEREK